ncbi:MAG: NAD(P)H-hydrate epimerase [Chloroflexi bacterium]|nr:MAG: NAD(P)H-hydrate epimerase [Chloroflexota bacterium]
MTNRFDERQRMTTTQRVHFATALGQRVPAVTVAEMHDVDRISIEATGPALLQLLELAGQQTALAALDMLGDRWPGARVVVLCGSGHNGAAGVCAARHLANRGLAVEVITVVPLQRADGALGEAFLALGEAPARITRWDEAFDVSSADLIIDAILGCRLRGRPHPVQAGLIRAAQGGAESGVPILSLDSPSGLDADRGIIPGYARIGVRPTRTLTIGLPKRGLTRANSGDLWLADIGIPPGVFARAGIAFAPFFGTEARIPLVYPDGGAS